MPNINSFVERELGSKALSNLKNIQKGGLNNKKGRDYENFFQLAKAFELASQKIDHKKHFLSCQELAFIDDICHRDEDLRIKYNYQAKNSFGGAANWTREITRRCESQTILDIHFHQMSISRNYLLVSCPTKRVNNLSKIPRNLKKYNTCAFFPDCKNLLELVNQTSLKQSIETLIENNDASNVDYAAKLVLGILQGTSSSTSIDDIFTQACSTGYPNPFIKFRKTTGVAPKIPDWIDKIVTNPSNNTAYRIQSDRIILSFKGGLEVSALQDLILQVPESERQGIITTKDLAKLFMSLTSRELDMNNSLDPSPPGGA